MHGAWCWHGATKQQCQPHRETISTTVSLDLSTSFIQTRRKTSSFSLLTSDVDVGVVTSPFPQQLALRLGRQYLHPSLSSVLPNSPKIPLPDRLHAFLQHLHILPHISQRFLHIQTHHGKPASLSRRATESHAPPWLLPPEDVRSSFSFHLRRLQLLLSLDL